MRFRRRKPEPSALEQRDTWLAWMLLGGASPNTVDGYRQITNKLIERYPEFSLRDFTEEHIQGLIEEARPASRQARRGAFSNWFGWAYRTRRVELNPMHHVPTYKQPPAPAIEVFTEAECKVLCALPHPDGTLMALLLGSGIRKGEARHLTVRRIDFENAELHIVEAAKGGSIGVIPLDHRLVSRLAEYVILEGLNEGDFFWYCHPGGAAVRRHDRAIADGAFHNWWVRCIEASGVRYRKPHTTRHSFATEWRRRGLSTDDVGDLLRHADPRTTKRVYIHFKAIELRKKMEAIGE